MDQLVFVLPVMGKWLLYAPLHNVTALLNRKAVESLQSGGQTTGSSSIEELRGLLSNRSEPEPRPKHGSLNPEFLGIIPTRACNMGCVYCGFGASCASDDQMDLQLAAAAVGWMAQRMQELGRQILEIHFFGGEPFCAGEVVDTVIHKARMVAAKAGLTSHFEVATNGVLHEERCRFIGDYFNTVVLSFDGPEEIQNRHRPTRSGRGAFRTVARSAEILSQAPAELCIRSCITQDTVGQMEEICRWFCKTFRPSIINFETLQPTPESESAGLKPPDPWELAVHYIRAARVAERYGVRLVYAAAMTETTRFSFCPVATDTVIISPDGRVSACYLLQREWKARGLDMDMGSLTTTGQMNLDQQAVEQMRNLPVHKPRCEGCLARWHCAGGCHVNHSFPGCAEEYDAFCIQTRIILTCHLLDKLGCMELVDRLVEDQRALEDLALQPSDRLGNILA